MKKLQSCAGKADMFVERSRNKSIDKRAYCATLKARITWRLAYLYVIFRIEREWNAEYEETEATGGN